jgi:hypothetical protein
MDVRSSKAELREVYIRRLANGLMLTGDVLEDGEVLDHPGFVAARRQRHDVHEPITVGQRLVGVLEGEPQRAPALLEPGDSKFPFHARWSGTGMWAMPIAMHCGMARRVFA